MSAVVDPTAASAWLPLNRPTTMISTALNISCRMPDTISGSEKEISLSIIVPLHMSISYLFFFKNTPPSFVADMQSYTADIYRNDTTFFRFCTETFHNLLTSVKSTGKINTITVFLYINQGQERTYEKNMDYRCRRPHRYCPSGTAGGCGISASSDGYSRG